MLLATLQQYLLKNATPAFTISIQLTGNIKSMFNSKNSNALDEGFSFLNFVICVFITTFNQIVTIYVPRNVVFLYYLLPVGYTI